MPGVAGHSAPTARRSPSPACAARSATSSSSTSRPADPQRDQRRSSATTRRPSRPTASRSSISRASAATTSCSGSIWRAARRRSSRSARTTTAARSSSTTTRSCSRRRRPIRTSRSTPEVARNGNIYNIWTLNLKNGELKQCTDTLTGNVSPIVLRDQKPAEDRVRHLLQGRVRHPHADRATKPLHTVASADFGAPGPDHRLPGRRSVTRWSSTNIHKKGTFEKLFLEGRPPVNARRHQRRRPVRRHAGDVHRRARRQAVQLLRLVGVAVPDDVVLVHEPVAPAAVRAAGVLADAVLLRLRPGRCSTARSTRYHRSRPGDRDADRAGRHGVRHLSVQPLRARRAVRRLLQFNQELQRPGAAAGRRPVPAASSTDARCSRNGTFMPLGADLRAGDDGLPRVRTARRATPCALGYEYAPKVGSLAVAADVRRRRALLPAARRPTACWRSAPAASRAGASSRATSYFGGNSELRGYDYLEFLGNKAFFANARAALPADRSGADAARRDRRPARRRVRRHRRARATKACR